MKLRFSVLRWRLMVAALLCVGVLAVSAAARAPVSFEEIEESLTCQCGCGLTVRACNHLQCGSAIPLRREIREQIALGKTKAQIIAYFRNKYGEKILSAPPASGFDLLAWVTPFVLVGVGGLFVGIALVRWSSRKPEVPPDDAPTGPQRPVRTPSAYDKIVEKELKNFDG